MEIPDLAVSWDLVQMLEFEYVELSSQNLLIHAHRGDVEENVGLVYVHCQRPRRAAIQGLLLSPLYGVGDEKDKAEDGWIKEEKQYI